MDEKIIVKSEQYNTIAVALVTTVVILIIGLLIVQSIIPHNYVNEQRETINEIKEYIRNGGDETNWMKRRSSWGDTNIPIKKILNEKRNDLNEMLFFQYYIFAIIPSLLIGLIVYWWLSKIELIITDRRAYGKTVFGKRVDLPIDSISAVGSKWPKGIAVATSSGRIGFLMIKNRDEIHKCVSDLLIERQSKPTTTTTIKQEVPQSDADELKKYKELLDSGIITQEEFNAKKKQLLGL